MKANTISLSLIQGSSDIHSNSVMCNNSNVNNHNTNINNIFNKVKTFSLPNYANHHHNSSGKAKISLKTTDTNHKNDGMKFKDTHRNFNDSECKTKITRNITKRTSKRNRNKGKVVHTNSVQVALKNLYPEGQYTGPGNPLKGKPRNHNELVSAQHDIYYLAFEIVTGLQAYKYKNKGDERALENWGDGFFGRCGQAWFTAKKSWGKQLNLPEDIEFEIDRQAELLEKHWRANEFWIDDATCLEVYDLIHNASIRERSNDNIDNTYYTDEARAHNNDSLIDEISLDDNDIDDTNS
eukprot:Awhi_evm2s55